MHRVVPFTGWEDVAQGVPIDSAVVGPIDTAAVVVLLRKHVVVKLHGVGHIAVEYKEGGVQ